MAEEAALPPDLAARTVFLVWGPPAYTVRTRLLAAQLGIDVHHIYSTRRRGARAAPMKYSYQAVATLVYLFRHRPKLVFVQNPPGLAVMFVAFYAALARKAFVVDAHSDAFLSRYWSRPVWIYRILARRAVATIVTNTHFAGILDSWDARSCIIRDIPSDFERVPFDLGPEFNVAVVATFAFDEPIDEVFQAAELMPTVRFRVTGDTNRENASIPEEVPPNVELTGYLPAEDYYGLLHDSDAVMVLTTRNHTMQRGACEALSVGTPIITSDWPVLVDYFGKGAVYVDNTTEGIQRGVKEMQRDLDRYRAEILDLGQGVDSEWQSARDQLLRLVAEECGDGANVSHPAGVHA